MRKIQFLATTLALGLFLTISCNRSASDEKPKVADLTGIWYNHKTGDRPGCSTMKITENQDGALVGVYSNGQEGWCAKPGVWYHLSAVAAGSATAPGIAFQVDWHLSKPTGGANCKSIALWAGARKDSQLETTWILRTDAGEIYQGKDVFYRDCRCASCPNPP